MEQNIYRIDDLLIRSGWLATLIAVIVSVVVITVIKHGAGFGLIAVLMLCPIALLIPGYSIRRKEQRILAIKRLLQHSPQIHLEKLAQNSGFSRAEIKEAISVLNTKGIGFFTLNEQTGVISDGRLHSEFLGINQCPTCGAGINIKLSAAMDQSPSCPYCQTAIPADTINQLKLNALEFISKSNAQLSTPDSGLTAPQSGKKTFSLFLFLLLLFTFWPAALWYVLRHRNQLSRLSDQF
ncbi:MAG: hypothetical protein K0U68_05460 [Gammaproteobacteria bacterium]|nr:hypothetical protein [Gammaproteobacteria bacterium]